MKDRHAHATDEPPSKRVKRVKRDESHVGAEGSDEDLRPGSPLLKRLPVVRRVDTLASELGDDDTPQNSEAEAEAEAEVDAEADVPRRTAIEDSLPETKSGKEALEEYENFRASQDDGGSASAASRLDSRKWVRGKTSLYVDAFNLALGTVLDEESHLFDDKEMYIFGQWNKLSYDAQFLYVTYEAHSSIIYSDLELQIRAAIPQEDCIVAPYRSSTLSR